MPEVSARSQPNPLVISTVPEISVDSCSTLLIAAIERLETITENCPTEMEGKSEDEFTTLYVTRERYMPDNESTTRDPYFKNFRNTPKQSKLKIRRRKSVAMESSARKTTR